MKTMKFLVAMFLLAACAPAAGVATDQPQGGAVYIGSAELLIMESYPVQIALRVTGDLPTPCHSFNYAYQIGSPDDRFRVNVSAWSESDPAAFCVQVLEPFEVSIPISMEGAADGAYSVWLNGELVGEFSYPA